MKNKTYHRLDNSFVMQVFEHYINMGCDYETIGGCLLDYSAICIYRKSDILFIFEECLNCWSSAYAATTYQSEDDLPQWYREELAEQNEELEQYAMSHN